MRNYMPISYGLSRLEAATACVYTVCKNKTSKFSRFYVKFDFKSRLGASEEGLFLKAYLKLLTTVPIF